MTPPTMTAAHLIARREAMGLSQAHLAKLLRVTPATISRWESGERTIQMAGVVDLALQTLEREHAQADTPESVERKMAAVDAALSSAMRHLM